MSSALTGRAVAALKVCEQLGADEKSAIAEALWQGAHGPDADPERAHVDERRPGASSLSGSTSTPLRDSRPSPEVREAIRDLRDERAESDDDDRLFTEAQLADLTNTSRSMWRNRRYRKEAPPFVRLGRRMIRYRLSDIIAWCRFPDSPRSQP